MFLIICFKVLKIHLLFLNKLVESSLKLFPAYMSVKEGNIDVFKIFHIVFCNHTIPSYYMGNGFIYINARLIILKKNLIKVRRFILELSSTGISLAFEGV